MKVLGGKFQNSELKKNYSVLTTFLHFYVRHVNDYPMHASVITFSKENLTYVALVK